MNSVNLNMTSVEVKAETRATRATWTPEMAKDIQSLTDLNMSSFENFFVKQLRVDNRKNSIKNIFPD